MFELITLFMMGGGSAAMGSVLKGVFGALSDARENKLKVKMAWALKENENALKFQEQLTGDPETSKYVRHTRRLLALICLSTLCLVFLLCTIYPSVPLVTLSNLSGEGERSFLFGLFTFPAKQAALVLTTGHIAVFEATVVYPMIIGFYFTPGGRR